MSPPSRPRSGTLPALVLEQAVFGYPGHVVLPGVSLTLPGGGVIALTGDNGAGKTTFLRTLCGLQPLLGGALRFTGTAGAVAPRPGIGLVGQRDRLDDLYLFSGYEVVLNGARAAGRSSLRRRVADSLEQTGATAFDRRRFSELSGGQRQRILLARALALQPDWLVLDEPTSGVDAPSAQRLAALLEELRDTAALTILLASHDTALLARVATHRVHLSGGAVTLT